MDAKFEKDAKGEVRETIIMVVKRQQAARPQQEARTALIQRCAARAPTQSSAQERG
jgi:hypothetical protein